MNALWVCSALEIRFRKYLKARKPEYISEKTKKWNIRTRLLDRGKTRSSFRENVSAEQGAQNRGQKLFTNRDVTRSR